MQRVKKDAVGSFLLPTLRFCLVVGVFGNAAHPAGMAVEGQNLGSPAMAISRDDGGLAEILFGFVGQRRPGRLGDYGRIVGIGPAAGNRQALIQARHAVRAGPRFFDAVVIIGAGKNRRAVCIGLAVGDQPAEGAAVWGRLAVRVIRVHMNRKADLMIVREAGGGPCVFAHFLEDGEQYRRDHGDNGDDDE